MCTYASPGQLTVPRFWWFQVTDIIVCGHYGCGGVRAAMENVDHGLLEHWLLNVRNVIRLHNDELQVGSAAWPPPTKGAQEMPLSFTGRQESSVGHRVYVWAA